MRKQYGLAQRDIAARMGVSIARVSQIEHGEVATLDVVALCRGTRRPTGLGCRFRGSHGAFACEW
ncbi:helix-turn-helix domain-containing protein [Streptomyces sp. NPDC058656]|uniref:helix-turn-helix domain-containing protein n=1 Tax=Streptomyces sp. NPDC058656 TaxID=3346578 RepID=UPI003645F7A6